MKKILLILFFIKTIVLFSQNIDSLKQLINTENIEQRTEVFLSLADVYFYTFPDSTNKYLHIALTEAKNINNLKKQAKILIRIGILNNERGNIEKAKSIFTKSLKIAEEIKDTALILSSKGNLGNCYLNLNRYNEAIKSFSEVIEIAEKNNNTHLTAIAYGALGNLYLVKNEYKKALEYYKVSEEKFKKLNNTNGIALSLLNIATVYSNLKKYKEAFLKYKEADRLFKKNKNNLNSAKCLSGMAKVYLKINEHYKSIKYENEALKTYKKLDTRMDISYAYSMISTNYMKLNKYETAIIYLDSAMNVQGTEKNYVKSEQLFDKLRICYDSLGNFKKAYKYSLLHKIYYDSTFNFENEKKFSELEIKFETAKNEEKLLLYEKNEELLQNESKNRLILLISVSSFLILLLLLLFLFYNSYKLKNKIKQTNLENKLMLVQMNPHFIFNTLSSIEYYIYKNDIQKSALYIADFAKLMRLILESSRKEFINLSQEIEIINYYITFQKLRVNYNLDFSITVSEDINIENCLFPPMLIQPFIENAIKHGFTKEIKNAEIRVTMDLRNNFIFVEIEDNGIGINYTKSIKSYHESLSIQITKERLQKLFDRKNKNKLIIRDLSESNSTLHGTKINFKIPYVEEF